MSKRLAVLAGTLVSVLFLVPVASATNSNQISIPFTTGKASITEISATVTKTTTGSTTGIPFTFTIASPAKLLSKIKIAAIGGLNGVSGVPGNQVLTYQIFVAIDATGTPATAPGGSALAFKIAGGNFLTVKPGKYAVPGSCGHVGDASKSLIKMGIDHLPHPSFEEFAAALKKACPIAHK